MYPRRNTKLYCCTTAGDGVLFHLNTNSMSKSFWDHPIETIEKALHIRKQIEALKQSLNDTLAGNPEIQLPFFIKKDGRKGKRSAATRAKMKAAQQARWAKKKGLSVAKAAKKRRVVSKASRAKMAAAQRARWSKKRIDAAVNMPNKLIW